ncbi:hypothetical protein GCM10010267_43070 [Streptomyces griseorubens]|uniref:hypothetical protein n=1 Tax=Streptomyces griseorubens TaxID=66897 RepID=UPI00177BDA41|nr:hypothetical protein GCM10010267_43070 [Streptomyces griseorubens]
MKLARRIIATGAVAAACGATVIATGLVGPHDASAAATVAGEEPGYAVEDFNYPQADKIKDEQGIVLKRGDGHITLAPCGSQTGLLEVYTRANQIVCFSVTGPTGYLSLEIPSVYGVKGAAGVEADVTLRAPDEAVQEVTVPENSFEPVGESIDPNGRSHILVEIRTSA